MAVITKTITNYLIIRSHQADIMRVSNMRDYARAFQSARTVRETAESARIIQKK